jgi:hypothetical protein
VRTPPPPFRVLSLAPSQLIWSSRAPGDVFASRTGCEPGLIPRKLNELLVAEDIINVIGIEKV